MSETLVLDDRKHQQKRLWKKFRANPKLWIERCLRLVDSEGNERPFVFNQIQQEYYEILMALYWKPYSTGKNGEIIYRLQGAREVNLKARQFGLSSAICALLSHDSIFFKNTKSYIFCQDDAKSKEMFEDKIKYYFDSIPADDPLILKPKAGRDNVNQISIKGNKSKIYCQTPGMSERISRGKGRSITLRNALLSEMAEYNYPGSFMQGLVPALRDPSTNIFIESSARMSGDHFHDMYEDGKKPESVWNSRFWPWFKYEKYQTPFNSEAHRIAFEESLSDEEIEERDSYGLSLEQLLWRRETISYFGGKRKGLERFRQDYPSNDRDCFSLAADLFFNEPDVNIKRILTTPRTARPGNMHVIAVDPAKGKGGDYIVIDVYDAITREQVFTWSSNTFSIRRLHLKIYEIFKQYPGVVGVEANGIGEAVMALLRLIDDLDFQRFVYRTSKGHDGWYTGSNKTSMLYEAREELEEAVAAYADVEPEDYPDTPQGVRLSCHATVDEMYHFQDLGDGKMGASGNKYDDHIMTLAIACQLMKISPAYKHRLKEYLKKQEPA